MNKAIMFLKAFGETLVNMVQIIFYASCAMLFVAGLLMAYAGWPFNFAMATILIPSAIGVVVAFIVAHSFTYGRYRK